MSEAKFSDLKVRILSAVVLMVFAAAMIVAGGHFVAELVALGVALMLWEYRRFLVPDMTLTDPRLWLYCGLGIAVVGVLEIISVPAALGVAAIGMAIVALVERRNALWLAPGLAYIALGLSIMILIRAGLDNGLARILWIILVVIAADVGGYFAGRIFGGPKLWPRVSPKKTWAGSIGGIVLAGLMGAIFWIGGWIPQPQIVLTSALIAAASQAGDLLESWIKRRYGVKDSSSLIPGHGGLLDRFDGLLGALWAYGLLALAGIVPI